MLGQASRLPFFPLTYLPLYGKTYRPPTLQYGPDLQALDLSVTIEHKNPLN